MEVRRVPPRSSDVRRVPGSRDVRAVPSDVRAVPASPELSFAAPPLPALTLDALELRCRMLGSATAAAHTCTHGGAASTVFT
jgi:hypothetical protein